MGKEEKRKTDPLDPLIDIRLGVCEPLDLASLTTEQAVKVGSDFVGFALA